MKLNSKKGSRVGYFYSNDGGYTWNGSEQIHSESNHDPTVAYDANGNVYLCYLRPWSGSGAKAAIFIEKSTNNGLSWQTRTQLSAPDIYDIDKPFLAIDNNANSPYLNKKYVFWVYNRSIPYTIYFSSSDNFSAKKKIAKNSSSSLMSPYAAIGNNGEIYAVFGIGYPKCTGIGFLKSTDGGQTFTQYVKIASVEQIGTMQGNHYVLNNAGIRVDTNPSIAVDPLNGAIYVVYQSKNSNRGSDVFMVKYTYGDNNWSSPIRVNNDETNTDQWFPSISVSESHKITIVYYDRSIDPQNNTLSTVSIAYSNDGGNVFHNYDVSNISFRPKPLSNSSRGQFMGDYIRVASNNNKAFPVWVDDHQSGFEIYTSLIDYEKNITVNQLREDGRELPLDKRHIWVWENNSFVQKNTPATLPTQIWETKIIKGIQDTIRNPSEKYNRWNVDNNVTNFREFEITSETNEIIAKLKPTY